MNVPYLFFRLPQLIVFGFFLLFLAPNLQANDCGSATLMTTGSSYTLGFAGVCNYQPSNQKVCKTPSYTCSSDAWFKWVPGGTQALQQDVTFAIELNFTGAVHMSILYSESKDGGNNDCSWDAGGNKYGYTQYTAYCNETLSPGTPFNLRHSGLDGSGVYFILIERSTGTGGTVTVTPTVNGTCPQPSNDRCATPIALSSGNGIDPTANMPGATNTNWAYSFSASTNCATKQRLQADNCNNGNTNQTEDHYVRKVFLQGCKYDGNLGGKFPITGTDRCDEYLENTVFYSFQVPTTEPDWAIHFKGYSYCGTGPNNMVAMLFSSLDCNDAEGSVLLECDKFNVNGVFPPSPTTPDITFNNGGGGHTLYAGHTYYIALDGTRGSQCDIEILVTRDPLTVVLPLKISNFEGENHTWTNILSWETEFEENHDHFEVEKSSDAQNFIPIGQVMSKGDSETTQKYEFQDASADIGMNYYRLKSVNVNGDFTYSEVLGIFRENDGIEIKDVYPIPVKENIHLVFATAESGKMAIKLLDLAGREIYQTEKMVEKGNNQMNIPAHNLAQGMYLLQLTQSGKTKSKMIRK